MTREMLLVWIGFWGSLFGSLAILVGILWLFIIIRRAFK